MKIEGKTLLTFLLVMGIVSCIAQDVSYQQFTEADGLPSMTIYEIVQDNDGILWMGTENGVVSYDGLEFTT
jgi:ligand-binding sensor domain-containing protein